MKHLAPLAAVAALMWAAPAHATLQYAISVDGGPSFVCVDNVGACDINPAVGVIQSVTTAVGGIEVTFGDQRQIIGPPQNALTTTSATITNTNGSTSNIQFAVSGTSFAAPTSAFSVAGSGTWLNAGGSNIQMQYYDDPANNQGAESATDLPGSLLASSPTFTSNGTGTDGYSFTQDGAFANGGPFSYTMYANLNLTAGATDILLGRSQDVTSDVVGVPEPGTLGLLGAGLLGLGAVLRRRRRQVC